MSSLRVLAPLFLFVSFCLPPMRPALRASRDYLQPRSTAFKPRSGDWSPTTVFSTTEESALSNPTVTATSTSTSSTAQPPNTGPNNGSSSKPKEPVMPYELTTLAHQLWDTACGKLSFVVQRHNVILATYLLFCVLS